MTEEQGQIQTKLPGKAKAARKPLNKKQCILSGKKWHQGFLANQRRKVDFNACEFKLNKMTKGHLVVKKRDKKSGILDKAKQVIFKNCLLFGMYKYNYI